MAGPFSLLLQAAKKEYLQNRILHFKERGSGPAWGGTPWQGRFLSLYKPPRTTLSKTEYCTTRSDVLGCDPLAGTFSGFSRVVAPAPRLALALAMASSGCGLAQSCPSAVAVSLALAAALPVVLFFFCNAGGDSKIHSALRSAVHISRRQTAGQNRRQIAPLRGLASP